ncbi:PLP-dependent aminotransferase family protein [Streptomonospora algeriensis]|uniref:PLP-dependent aminotransferase family protein n=1 Tax=Streptomonospora algeriensis TaxID=995084 RepID=A0ABW3BAG9_9ACTN
MAIASEIRALVLSGQLPVGAQLPSERASAEGLGVSRTTASAAYRVLRTSGLITTAQGRRAVLQIPRGGVADIMPEPHEGEMIDLATGAPMPHSELLESLYREAASMLPVFFSRTSLPVYGLLELRRLVAQRFTERGLPTEEDEVLITAGAQDALRRVLEAETRRGDSVLVEQPTYPQAANLVMRAGRAPASAPIGLPPDEPGWDSEKTAAAYTRARPICHYTIPDGHNPTGLVMGDDARRSLAATAESAGTTLLVDETTTELTSYPDRPRPRPLASYVRNRRLAVTVGSLSKIYWPGLRVGWVRAGPEVIASLAMSQSGAEASCSIMDQLTAMQVFRNMDSVRAIRSAQLSRSRAAAMQALADALPDAQCIQGDGFTLWVRLSRPLAPALCASAQARGVRIRPGPHFGFDESFSDYIRIPLVQPPDVLKEGIGRLGETYAQLG